MSLLRRFGHLEGQRPARDDARSAAAGAERFRTLEVGQAPCACAMCGEPLADADAACPVCSGPVGAAQAVGADGSIDRGPAPLAPAPAAGASAARFEEMGAAPIELAREIAPRTEADATASTVPAWRGEALPDDVAAEVRSKLGLPDPAVPARPPLTDEQRRDPLGWADRAMRRGETDDVPAWALILFGRRRHRGGGLLPALLFLLAVFAWRACR